jgi:hypothetical protein
MRLQALCLGTFLYFLLDGLGQLGNRRSQSVQQLQQIAPASARPRCQRERLQLLPHCCSLNSEITVELFRLLTVFQTTFLHLTSGGIHKRNLFSGEIGSRTSTLSQVQQALEKAGIQFLNDESPGVRVRKK